MRTHYKVQEARNQAKAAIAARIEELKEEIRIKITKAEDGAAWADICALEVELVGLGGSY